MWDAGIERTREEELASSILEALREKLNREYCFERAPFIVRDAIASIIEHFHESEFSITALKRELRIRSHTFERLFGEAAGLTPWEFMTTARLSGAIVMIGMCVPLKNIHAYAGFKSSRNFIRSTRSIFGHSPGYIRDHFEEVTGIPIDRA